ncbi:MAG TPA: heparinase II/III family protein [Verrucomicrobiae bacterium]|jgi:hypothetical protein
MKSKIFFAIAMLFFCAEIAMAHPQILVSSAEHDAIKSKLEQSPWAKQSYAELKSRVDFYVSLCRTNPQFMSSRLFMNWQTHYATPLVQKSRIIGGEGRASVPTPRFGGARDWATKYQAPAKLEALKPYNDNDGKVWLFNSETKTEEWADPGLTGRMFEIVNTSILQTAADAAFVYWITGDEKYARYADEILWTYMDGFSQMQPPKITDGGGAQVIGFDSFEVIHEDIVTPLAESYDFLYDDLKKNGRDVKLIQAQFKRMADRVVDGGSRDGNWNLNQARIIAYAGLTLEDNTNYSDGRGRPYYVDVILNAELPAQKGLTHVIKEGFDLQSGIWPEAPGYSFGTTKDIALIASLVSGDEAGRAVLADPILPKAILAQASLTYPNGYSVGLGDTVNTRVNTETVELLLAAARQRGDAALEESLTAILRREITLGYYNRSANANLVALTKYAGDLKKVSPAADNGQRTYFGRALNVLMQHNLGEDSEHSLGAAMYGTAGGHVHANGLAIELYGAGLTLGADPGRGTSYWQADHAQYYSQPPAHNTVIVNGRSNYPITRRSQIAMKLDLIEPAPGENGISPDISFAQASFHYDEPAAEQQRTLALVRISPQAGFYFDVFRSRAENATNSFHDYLYHNIGQSLSLNDENGNALSLTATGLLTSTNGNLKGYDYFKDEKSAELAGNFNGVFTATLADGSKHLMNFWMLGEPERRVFSVTAPPDHAAREELHGKLDEIPMPTLVVRQSGDAWQKSFIAVYEPALASEGVAIQSVRAAKTDGENSSLAACVVEGHETDNGKKSFSICLAQNDQTNADCKVEGFNFNGSFGVAIRHDGELDELYLAHGQNLGDSKLFLSATNDSLIDAALIRNAEGWRYSASAAIKAGLVFPLPAGTSPETDWTIWRQDGTNRTKIEPSEFRVEKNSSGQDTLAAVCILPAGRDQQLRIGLPDKIK